MVVDSGCGRQCFLALMAVEPLVRIKVVAGTITMTIMRGRTQDGWFDSSVDMRRYPDYYRENWRFFHMKRPEVNVAQQGLVAEYYDSRTFRGLPTARRLVPFNGSSFSLPGGDQFSARFVGFLRSGAAGNYKFYHRVDDGIRVWIDGNLVVNHWTTGSASDRTGGDLLMQEEKGLPNSHRVFRE